jgi:hypothetical protein
MTLPEIIDSKTDSAVLSFFLVAPQRGFSIPEISKRLNIAHQKASHSLNKIAQSGLLRGFSKRSKKYFLLNLRHKLLPEVRREFIKDAPKYKDELFAAVKKLGDVKAAFLSGIFTGHPNLPVDLLLVGKINLKKLADFLKSAKKMMGQEINYSMMTVNEFQLRRDTFDKFIKDIFDYRHIVVFDSLTKKIK